MPAPPFEQQPGDENIRLLVVTREIAVDRRYGLARSLSPVLTALAARGVDVRYLSQTDLLPQTEARLGRAHHSLNRLLGWLPSRWVTTNLPTLSWGLIERLNMGRLAAKFAAAGQITHVHCHDPLIAAGFQWFRRFKGLGAVRYGITQHGYGSYTQALHEDGVQLGPWVMARMREWERRILRRADWVIAPTHASLNQLARDLGCYPRPTHWHCITHPRFPLQPHERDAARTELEWHAASVQLISVGRHVPLKDFRTLFQACARLQTRRPWQLTVLGDGDWGAVQAMAQAEGLPPERLALRASDDISLWYAAADLYVSTSLTESFGMANHEALCAGLPAVLTATTAVPEVAGNAAAYVAPGQLEQLAAVLDRLIDGDAERSALAQRSLAHAAGWPKTETLADAYLACYQGRPLPEIRRTAAGTAPLPVATAPWQSRLQQASLFRKPEPLPLNEAERVLVFAPHPDDETFSMGGTLLTLKALGAKITVVLMTVPAAASDGSPSPRIAEWQRAMAAYGVDRVESLELTDGELFNHAALQARIGDCIRTSAATVIFAPPVLDLHRDHTAAALAIIQGWSDLGFPARLYCYELWQPQACSHWVDISDQVAQKRAIISLYQEPLRHMPYQEICHHLQSFRYRLVADDGAGGEAAEAFMQVLPQTAQSIINASLQLRRAVIDCDTMP